MRLSIIVMIWAAAIVLSGCDASSDAGAEAPVIPVIVDVKLKVGDVLYENLDATIIVTGYNESEQAEWTKDFEYSSEDDNVFAIPGKHHHYTFRLEKWGHTDEQTFSILQLHDQRADGLNPGVLVLGGEVPAHKLATSTLYMKLGPTETPTNKKVYTYDNTGRLTRMDYFTYDGELNEFSLYDYRLLTYENNRVSKIEKYGGESGELTEALTYEYNSSGTISRMQNVNHEAAVTSAAELNYNTSTGTIQVTYTNSRGAGLSYTMQIGNKNIQSETVSTGGELCQEGDFAYDKNINPLRHLGYIDFFFTNYSVNNRISESVEYNCSYPSLIPTSFQYVYNDKGLPVESLTTYQGGGTAREIFEYK